MATWTKEAVSTLIDAYKNEPCLYETNNPNYHNKNLRNESLERISVMVNTVRPNTTSKECAVKFYSLRSQFTSENAKVRASIKSGIGSENVSIKIIYRKIKIKTNKIRFMLYTKITGV